MSLHRRDNTRVSLKWLGNSLKTKNIVNFARFHFDCMSIDRVYLENDGPEMSAGQHFE